MKTPIGIKPRLKKRGEDGYSDQAMRGSRRGSEPVLSVVIPVLNEAPILHDSYTQIKRVLDDIGESYEIVFVNDGSSDGSFDILEALAANDISVVVVNLSRNFGHELATSAGLTHCRGKAAVILDADLQDPPEVIKEFLSKWREGFEVVYGIRQSRRGETWLKKTTSFLFYRLMGSISDVPIPADTGDFRLIDRRVIDVFLSLKENPRFFRGMISWIGFRQTGILFKRRPRMGGVSKYSYDKLVRLAFDTITSFSQFPAQAVLGGALACFVVSIAGTLGLLGWWGMGWTLWGPTQWFSLLILFVLNVNVGCMALLGQYIVRTHKNTQGRPLFTLDTVIRDGKKQSKSQFDRAA